MVYTASSGLAAERGAAAGSIAGGSSSTKIIWPVGLARRSGPVGNLLTGQKTLTGQIGNGNEVAGVKVGKFRERVHNFASTDQMEATNSANPN